VLIHESILPDHESFEGERERWDLWLELSGGGLPLPLGGMAVRRSLPITRAIEYEDVLTKAVEVAHKNEKLLSKMLLERDLIRVDAEKLERYLELYANEDSISMSDKQLDAIDKLFELGFNAGYYPEKLMVRDYLVPKEYYDYRFA
jgi:1,4-dihydroxy-6-naphthoate synthase